MHCVNESWWPENHSALESVPITDEIKSHCFYYSQRYPWPEFLIRGLHPGHLPLPLKLGLAALGAVTNFLVIALSFFSQKIDPGTGFKYFFGNLAVADAAYALFHIVMSVMKLLATYSSRYPMTLVTSTLVHCYQFAIPNAMILALWPISYNRYKVIIKQEDWFFTRKTILLLCLQAHLPLLFPVPYFLFPQKRAMFIRRPLHYVLDLSPYYGLHWTVPAPLIALAFTLYFTIRLHAFLWKAKMRAAKILIKSIDEVKAEKRLIRAMTIQSVQPILIVAPGVASFFVILATGGKQNLGGGRTIGGYWVEDMIRLIVIANPLLDAAATLCIVPAYRRALKQHLVEKFAVMRALKKTKVQPIAASAQAKTTSAAVGARAVVRHRND